MSRSNVGGAAAAEAGSARSRTTGASRRMVRRVRRGRRVWVGSSEYTGRKQHCQTIPPGTRKTHMTGIEAFLDVLAGSEVRHIFGNPGTTELPLNDALGRDSRF